MELGALFTYLLTVVGVVGGLMNPVIGLMVYIALGILRPSYLWFWVWGDGAGPRFSFYVALATLVGCAFHGLGDKLNLRGIRIPIYGLALYLASGVVAWLLFAVDADRARVWLEVQLKIGLMVFIAIMLIRTHKQIHILAWVLTATLGYLGWVFNEQYFMGGYNRIYFRGFGGVDNNGVAMMMVMGVPLAFFMGIKANRWLVKGLCFLAMILLAHVVLFSFSRGGQLGLVMVGIGLFGVALSTLPRKGLTIAVALVFAAAMVRLAGAEVREEFWSIFLDPSERDASAASRFDTWAAAWECMKDHPMGVGPRNFNVVSGQYGLGPNKSVHNLFLQTGADYGILGMIGLAMFYLGTMWQTFKMTFTSTAVRLKWPIYYGHMVCLSLAGFLVCSTFIGMESVETGFMISILGLCAVAHVERIAQAVPDGVIPELEQVPLPDQPLDEQEQMPGNVVAAGA